ncbi:hypothetical protein [Aeromicrobium sp. 9AM]|uniref:hypothetical protein n=1 Tax=Aeromicrobium sp. 9AM TaxID=2653126 RepID=UPI0012F3AF2B|nr:hypothetical protein [Aeromicrobium sp. 9AM]VXC21096.1 conserved hypothetical protein [Aeromicrobium sp. 9AM]
MIRFDKTDRDVLAICSCGWRHHAVGISIQASQAKADAAAHQHIGGPAHSVDELGRGQAMNSISQRDRRRDTP